MFSKFVLVDKYDRHGFQNKNSEQSKILSLGGALTPQKVFIVHHFVQELLKKYPALPKEFESHSALKLHDHLYCFGGLVVNESLSGSSEVWKQDITSQPFIWEQVASMNEKRYEFGADVFDDVLVVAGGNRAFKDATASAEIYEESLDQWKVIRPLKQKRYGNALVSCGGFLYALGGLDHDVCLASVEQLDTLKSAWKVIKPMQTNRYMLAAVSCNNELYAIGGTSSHLVFTSMKSVEKYDPVANKWKYVSDMKHARIHLAACTLRGKIYVVGGKNNRDAAVHEIECYDPSTDKWTVVANAEDELEGHALVAL